MEQPNALVKVTCLITREAVTDDRKTSIELLLIQHPHAGIQLPAGTAEPHEDVRQAAWREAYEETGLHEFVCCNEIGRQVVPLPAGQHILYQQAKVYSSPDFSSFQWAEIRRGITVQEERRHGDFVQVTYMEGDRYPEPNYITYQITGWVEEARLVSQVSRHFYHFHVDHYRDRWEHEADQHMFQCFWSPLDRLPEIVVPQDQWLKYVTDDLKYDWMKPIRQ